MGQLRYAKRTVTIRGSKELLKRLKNGDVKKISEGLNENYAKTYAVIEGRYTSEPEIVECAEAIVAYYESIQLDETVNKIIKSYESTN